MARGRKPAATTSAAVQEMEKLEKQFDDFNDNVKQLTQDRMNMAPKQDLEPQTKLAQKDIANSTDIYLKPKKTVASKEKFNEKFRAAYDFDKEYVQFIAENYEMIGESIELWTKPYPGVPAMFWEVPTNKPVHGPRYLAEQIHRKNYHRLKMDQSVITGHNGVGTMYGAIAVDTTVQRLDARPVTKRMSLFMGDDSFKPKELQHAS